MNINILQSWHNQWPLVKSTKSLPTDQAVVDQSAFNSIEVDKLFDSVNQASTLAGQAVLYRSLTQPLDSIADIQAKQEAIKEIQASKAIRDNLTRIVESAAAKESHLYTLFFGEFLGALGTAKEAKQIEGYGYKQYRHGIRFMLDLSDAIYSSKEPESVYLKNLFNN